MKNGRKLHKKTGEKALKTQKFSRRREGNDRNAQYIPLCLTETKTKIDDCSRCKQMP